METYFRKFPRVKPFLQEVLEQARDLGYVETIWGRRRFFRNLRSKSMGLRRGEERAAFNAPLQGSAADMIKIAMLRVQARLGGEDKLLLQVHDELVLEVPEERSQKVAEILAQEMVIDQPLKVPVEVEIKRGPNWADCRQI
jgi:DNA polymerase-1